MRRWRSRVAIVLLLAIFAFVVAYPWRITWAVGDAKLVVTYIVTDAKTGRPIEGAHVALYEETGPPTVIRSDAAGVARLARSCSTYVTIDDNPITGWSRSRRSLAAWCRWQVVITAGGYRPPDPWWMGGEDRLDAEDRGDGFYATIPVSLIPHGSTP
jgi:hypothetical protein